MYAPPDKDRQPSEYPTLPRGNQRIAEVDGPFVKLCPLVPVAVSKLRRFAGLQQLNLQLGLTVLTQEFEYKATSSIARAQGLSVRLRSELTNM